MKEVYTRKEVEKILLTMFILSAANNNQGLGVIAGRTIGDKIETVLTSFDFNKTGIENLTKIGKKINYGNN
jgi:hypothetical protein